LDNSVVMCPNCYEDCHFMRDLSVEKVAYYAFKCTWCKSAVLIRKIDCMDEFNEFINRPIIGLDD